MSGNNCILIKECVPSIMEREGVAFIRSGKYSRKGGDLAFFRNLILKNQCISLFKRNKVVERPYKLVCYRMLLKDWRENSGGVLISSNEAILKKIVDYVQDLDTFLLFRTLNKTFYRLMKTHPDVLLLKGNVKHGCNGNFLHMRSIRWMRAVLLRPYYNPAVNPEDWIRRAVCCRHFEEDYFLFVVSSLLHKRSLKLTCLLSLVFYFGRTKRRCAFVRTILSSYLKENYPLERKEVKKCMADALLLDFHSCTNMRGGTCHITHSGAIRWVVGVLKHVYLQHIDEEMYEQLKCLVKSYDANEPDDIGYGGLLHVEAYITAKRARKEVGGNIPRKKRKARA